MSEKIGGFIDYDIIWLAQEINSINRQIKILESDNPGKRA